MILEKIIKKIKCKKDGYKVVDVGGRPKCVKMSQDEIRNRKRAAKIAAMKRKAKMSQIVKKAQHTKKHNKDKVITKEI